MLDLDQNQFAHLEVEDESNKDDDGNEFDDNDDLMANFDIEVEDEGEPCESGGKRLLKREESNQILFNQADFLRFQRK
mgnify:CR=1 FL=1